ncbi:MAG: hypothetical protein ACYC9S_03180 [Leptospirales bacterium]
MKPPGKLIWILFLLMFVGLEGDRTMGWSDELSPLPGPPLPPQTKEHPSILPDRWSIAPTVGYFIPTGTGSSSYFNSALSVGAELSYRPGITPGAFRWIGSFSYLQMTPGPTLAAPMSGGFFGSSNPVTPAPSQGPLPGSASITGFIVKGGAARSFNSLLPESWTAWGTVSPYLRADIGMASFAASNAPPLSGHPDGLLLDLGGGIEWRVPGLPMGVFVEMDPSVLNMNGSFLFLTPLVSGISIWF